jgi:hypothetical protein
VEQSCHYSASEDGKVEFLNGLIKDAENYGAKIVNKSGGNAVGNLFAPTVLYPVNENMKIYHIEQFANGTYRSFQRFTRACRLYDTK